MKEKLKWAADVVYVWMINAVLWISDRIAALRTDKPPAKRRRRRKRRRIKPIRKPAAPPDPSQPIELQAITPDAYHGTARRRAAQRPAHPHPMAPEFKAPAFKAQGLKPRTQRAFRARKTPNRPLSIDPQKLLTFILAAVAGFSAVMILSILLRTVRTMTTNRQLAQIREQAVAASQLQTQAPKDLAVPESAATPMPTPEMAYATDVPLPTFEPTPTPEPKRVYQQYGGDALPEMAALYAENRDIVAWLRIENVLDLPVVYRDNDYYLTRDFYKQKNAAGTIFLDKNHPFAESTQNLLLHGHNMKDGTMFGRLVQYETDPNYVRWHPFIQFDTLWRREEYVIFAVLHVSLDVSSDKFVNYFSHPTFSSDASFNAYIREVMRHSIYDTWLDVKPTDALLTLSTCLDEDRLVIIARRVREGETHKALRELTSRAQRQ